MSSARFLEPPAPPAPGGLWPAAGRVQDRTPEAGGPDAHPARAGPLTLADLESIAEVVWPLTGVFVTARSAAVVAVVATLNGDPSVATPGEARRIRQLAAAAAERAARLDSLGGPTSPDRPAAEASGAAGAAQALADDQRRVPPDPAPAGPAAEDRP